MTHKFSVRYDQSPKGKQERSLRSFLQTRKLNRDPNNWTDKEMDIFLDLWWKVDQKSYNEASQLMRESSNGMASHIMNENPELVQKILTRPEDWK